MRLKMLIVDEDEKILFDHSMDYSSGKLKFMPSGKAIKDALKNHKEGNNDTGISCKD